MPSLAGVFARLDCGGSGRVRGGAGVEGRKGGRGTHSGRSRHWSAAATPRPQLAARRRLLQRALATSPSTRGEQRPFGLKLAGANAVDGVAPPPRTYHRTMHDSQQTSQTFQLDLLGRRGTLGAKAPDSHPLPFHSRRKRLFGVKGAGSELVAVFPTLLNRSVRAETGKVRVRDPLPAHTRDALLTPLLPGVCVTSPPRHD